MFSCFVFCSIFFFKIICGSVIFSQCSYKFHIQRSHAHNVPNDYLPPHDSQWCPPTRCEWKEGKSPNIGKPASYVVFTPKFRSTHLHVRSVRLGGFLTCFFCFFRFHPENRGKMMNPIWRTIFFRMVWWKPPTSRESIWSGGSETPSETPREPKLLEEWSLGAKIMTRSRWIWYLYIYIYTVRWRLR